MGGGTENNDPCHGEVFGKGEVSPVAGLCRFYELCLIKQKINKLINLLLNKGEVEEIEASYCK